MKRISITLVIILALATSIFPIALASSQPDRTLYPLPNATIDTNAYEIVLTDEEIAYSREIGYGITEAEQKMYDGLKKDFFDMIRLYEAGNAKKIKSAAPTRNKVITKAKEAYAASESAGARELFLAVEAQMLSMSGDFDGAISIMESVIDQFWVNAPDWKQALINHPTLSQIYMNEIASDFMVAAEICTRVGKNPEAIRYLYKVFDCYNQVEMPVNNDVINAIFYDAFIWASQCGNSDLINMVKEDAKPFGITY